MILHHISNNSKFIEISSTALRAKGFFERDLDIGNLLTSPRCTEKRIRKTQNEKILHHFFPKVMIDTESLQVNSPVTGMREGGEGPHLHSRLERGIFGVLVRIQGLCRMVSRPGDQRFVIRMWGGRTINLAMPFSG